MKNLSGIQVLSVALTVFFSTVFCLVSCKKETTTEECQIAETPSNEAYDVVAYLDPVSQTLWVDPQYREIALSELGAHLVDNSYYKMPSVTLSGQPVTARFKVMGLAVPYVYLQSLTFSSDVVSTFEIQGVPHRVVKNRTKDCNLVPGVTTGCVKNADSTSTHIVYYDWSTCSLVINEFKTCNQREVVGGRVVTYLSTNCTGQIKEEKPFKVWQCY